MLAADTELDIRTDLASLLGCHLNKLSYAVLVESCKRIRFVDLFLVILFQEFSCIIT